jgi:SseB protein C-terminal domain/SseB protein N-terminal domain
MAPLNDVERLLTRKDFGPQHHPQFFRLLRESELCFLIPYHPEMQGDMQLRNGDALPPFVIWQSPTDGRRIPIFSSVERAEEACKKTGARDNQYSLCEMLGVQLFDLLRLTEEGVALNPACTMPAMFFDTNAIKKLADGSILAPEAEESKQGTVTIVEPADYPTDFLQPIFRFLRERPEAEAAWLFREQTPPGARTSYVFVLKVRGDAAAVLNDFKVVATGACAKDVDYGVCLLDGQFPELEQVTFTRTPFYAAPGYKAPSPLGGE